MPPASGHFLSNWEALIKNESSEIAFPALSIHAKPMVSFILEREQNCWRWKMNFLQHNEDNSLGGNSLSEIFFFFLDFLPQWIPLCCSQIKEMFVLLKSFGVWIKRVFIATQSMIEMLNTGTKSCAISFSLAAFFTHVHFLSFTLSSSCFPPSISHLCSHVYSPPHRLSCCINNLS